MPYDSVYCTCEGRRFSLDHYVSGSCPRPPMFLPFIIGLVDRAVNDTRHADGNITATRCTSCPVSVLIRDKKNTYLDPMSLDSATKGTAWHRFCEDYPAPGAFTELEIPSEGIPPVKLFGFDNIGMKIDCYVPRTRSIHDLKGHKESTQRYKDPESKYWGPAIDEAIQQNIYRLGLAQVKPEWPVEHMYLHHAAMTSDKEKPWITEECPFMSEEQILDTRVELSPHTVREVLAEYKNFFERERDGMPLDANLKLVRLLGRNMWPDKKSGVGQKCLRWCDKGTKGACDALHGITSAETMIASSPLLSTPSIG